MQSLPCKGRCRRRRRRGAAPCHAFTLTGQQCPHRPANLSAVAMLSGGRDCPPCKANGGRDEKHLSAARTAFLAPVPGLGTCSRQIVGRAFTPAARVSGRRGVSGPMLGIVPQSCRSPQCLGAHSFFPLPSVYRQVVRRAKSPALQSKANGRRNRKLCLCGRRFFSRHPFAGDCRAGVHARRESFRPPRPSGSMPAPSRKPSGRRPASERAKRTDHQNSELLIPDPDPYHTQILSEMYKSLRQRKEPCHARCGQLAGL